MSRTLRRGIALRSPATSVEVKRRAKELGADLCGIASAATLNAFPPDPRWPQTPERISPYVKSVVVIVQRIPVGAFRCKTNVPVQYLDMLVLRRMDRIGLKLAQELERCGHSSFTLAAQETDWNLKRASYARLSTRHLGGESCSRCLHSCPPDAVRQWGLDKAGCATEAQEFGFAQITKFFGRFFDLPQ